MRISLALLAMLGPVVAFATDAPQTTPAAAQPTAIIKREGKRVLIENAPEVRWGKTNPCTFFGCLEAATGVTAHPVSYDAMHVYSGMAFRIRWYRGLKEDKWNGVSPIAELPEEMTAITKATGWRFDVRPGNASLNAADFCKSIDEGLCVLGYVNRKEFDVGFIRGYEDGGKQWMVCDYYMGYATVPAGDPHDLFILLRYEKPQFSATEALWHGLNTGVQNWQRGEPPAEEILPWEQKGQGKLCYGEAAYEQMIHDLQKADPAGPGNLRHVRAWVMDNMRDSRQSAAAFLKANAKLLGKDAEPSMLKAAEIYGRMADRIAQLQKTKEAFAFMEAPEWTDTIRKREVEELKELSKWDAEAIGELEKIVTPAADAK